MTILVDDAGWGCAVGGVLIAAYRVETQEFTAWEIPVTDFQGDCFTHRRYLSTAAVCTHRCLDTLRVGLPPHDAKEPIQICSGYIHSETHRQHPSFQIVKITGPFQARIEQALLEYLHKLGFPYQGSTEEYGKLFFEAIRWLKGGNPNRRGMDPDRVKLAKWGWQTFSAYRDHPYRKAVEIARAMKRRRPFGEWQ